MTPEQSKELVHFLRTLDRLEILPRTGYFFAGIPRPESIAAHSYGTAVVAMLLADRTPEPHDMEKVLRMALIHDMTEALLTDIPIRIFYLLGEAHKSEAETKAAELLFSSISADYLAVWREFEAEQTLEARIVHAADKLQLMIKILNYQRDRQGNFERLWDDTAVKNNWWGITAAAELYAEVQRVFALEHR